jgi:mono/diheme cytochrome c family protein
MPRGVWGLFLALGVGAACGDARDGAGGTGAARPEPSGSEGGSGASEPPAPAGSVPVAADAADAGAVSDCPPTRVVSDVSDDSDEYPKATISGLAVNIMIANCGACHTPGGSERVSAGPANVADFNLMIDEGFVVDCSAELSPIIISMRANEMPPPNELGFGISPYDIEPVEQFIEFRCSDEEKACAVSPSEPGCDAVMSARREWRCSL